MCITYPPSLHGCIYTVAYMKNIKYNVHIQNMTAIHNFLHVYLYTIDLFIESKYIPTEQSGQNHSKAKKNHFLATSVAT